MEKKYRSLSKMFYSFRNTIALRGQRAATFWVYSDWPFWQAITPAARNE